MQTLLEYRAASAFRTRAWRHIQQVPHPTPPAGCHPAPHPLSDSPSSITASAAVTIGTRLKNPETRAAPKRERPVIQLRGARIDAHTAAKPKQPTAVRLFTPAAAPAAGSATPPWPAGTVTPVPSAESSGAASARCRRQMHGRIRGRDRAAASHERAHAGAHGAQ